MSVHSLYPAAQRAVFLCALLLFFGAALAARAEPTPAERRLQALEIELRSEYGDVKHIGIADFRNHYTTALVIDVRAEEEFAVSRLPGAHHAANPEQIDALRARYPELPVVLYCSVGYRSAEATRALRKRDPSVRSANLVGSLFAWANAGLPLESASGATRYVHPYNFYWGARFLNGTVPTRSTPAPAKPLAE